MSKNTRPYVLITGVSTGIGHDATRYLIAHGYHVFGSVRKDADAQRLQQDFPQHFTPLLFDVSDAPAIAAAVAQVEKIVGKRGLAALVNNSGVSGTGPLMHVPMADVRQLFEVNVFGLLQVTQAFLPLLGARKNCPHAPGRIVNISSISGGLAFPLLGVYAGTKHAVEAMTDALRRELGIFGIEVIAIEPGNIKTPIWDKGTALDTRFDGTAYQAMMHKLPELVADMGAKADPVEKVSRAIHHAISTAKPKTRYPLTPLWHMARLLSDRLLDGITRKAMGIK